MNIKSIKLKIMYLYGILLVTFLKFKKNGKIIIYADNCYFVSV